MVGKMEIIPTFTITEFAEMKGTSRATVYNNIKKFTQNAKGKIVWDKKAEKWQPDASKVNTKYYKKGKQ